MAKRKRAANSDTTDRPPPDPPLDPPPDQPLARKRPPTARKSTGGKAPKIQSAVTASRTTGGPAPLMTLGPTANSAAANPPSSPLSPCDEDVRSLGLVDEQDTSTATRKSSRIAFRKSYTSFFGESTDDYDENPYVSIPNSSHPISQNGPVAAAAFTNGHSADDPNLRRVLSQNAMDTQVPSSRGRAISARRQQGGSRRGHSRSAFSYSPMSSSKFLPGDSNSHITWDNSSSGGGFPSHPSSAGGGFTLPFNTELTYHQPGTSMPYSHGSHHQGHRWGRGGAQGSMFAHSHYGGRTKARNHAFPSVMAVHVPRNESFGRQPLPFPGHPHSTAVLRPPASQVGRHAKPNEAPSAVPTFSNSHPIRTSTHNISCHTPLSCNPQYVINTKQDVYCAGCQDGGKLLRCEASTLYLNIPPCGRLICYGPPESRKCLELTDLATPDVLNDPQTALICPSCWTSIKDEDSPYPALVSRQDLLPIPNLLHMVNNARRSFFSPLDILPLVVISISLKGMTSLPYTTTLLHLESFYDGTDVPLLAESIQFDLLHERKKYDHAVKQFLAKIKTAGIQRIIVFFTTHATPDGALHFSPGGELHGASAITSQVLAGIFSDDFRETLSSMDTTLFILACGGAYLFEESFNSIGSMAEKRVFDRMIAFPAKDFQPSIASGWCNLFVHRVLLQRGSVERVLPTVCADNTLLGAHSQILVWTHTPTHPLTVDKVEDIQVLQVLKAMWCHAMEAPFGIRMTEAICSQCGVLRKREIVHHNGDQFFMVCCKARIEPPVTGPQGGAVPQLPLKPCGAKMVVVLRGSHLDAPKGENSASGTWFVTRYVWSADEGRDSF